MLTDTKGAHQGHLQIGAGAPRLPSAQRCRSLHQSIQTTFPQYTGRATRRFPVVTVGQIAAASRNHAQSAPAIARDTNCVSLRALVRKFRLQQNAIGPDGLPVPRSCQTGRSQNLGLPFTERALSFHVGGSLSDAQRVHARHQGREALGHGRVPT